jgi:hypothetical protein
MVDYKVDTIVREYLLEIGDGQFNRYTRFYQYAVSGVREWNMDMTGLPQHALLPVNDNDTINLPEDYLNYSFIGIIGTNGLMYPLAERKNISLQKQHDDCGEPSSYRPNDTLIANALIGIDPNLYATHFRNGELMGKYFGIGGGNNANGYFRIDRERGQLVLNGVDIAIANIYIEYISDITAVNRDYMIHPYMLETLKAWIYWKSIQRDRGFSLGEKDMAERAYIKAFRTARKRFNSTTLSAWYEAIRSGNKGAVKF